MLPLGNLLDAESKNVELWQKLARHRILSVRLVPHIVMRRRQRIHFPCHEAKQRILRIAWYLTGSCVFGETYESKGRRASNRGYVFRESMTQLLQKGEG